MNKTRLFILILLLQASASLQAVDDWLVGKWELVYDPDGAKKDWLEFLPDGDVLSSGVNGKVEGIYIVTPSGVKAVFTYKEQDIIMNFAYDRPAQALKIVTSHTGRASVYKKVEKPQR